MAKLANPTGTPTAQQVRALEVLNALHLRGLNRVSVESVMAFSGGLSDGEPASAQVQHHVARIVVEENALAEDRFAAILEVAAEFGAPVSLTDGKLTLWPRVAGD
jgi:hypothetical protein